MKHTGVNFFAVVCFIWKERVTAFVGFGATFLNVLGFLIKLSKSAVAFTYLILRGKHLSWQKHITMASF